MKKYIIPVAAFIAGMAIVPSVFAAEEVRPADPIKDGLALKDCLKAEDLEEGKVQVCKLDADFKLDATTGLNIDGLTLGDRVVLDLNGHNLKIKDALTVAKDKELTIMNSNSDVAEITDANSITVAAGGILTLDTNVTYDATGVSGVNVIDNAGTLTVNGKIDKVDGAKTAIWTHAGGNTVINNAVVNGRVAVYGGNVTAKGSTISPAAGVALAIKSSDKNMITIDIEKSTLTSKNDDVISVSGDVVEGTTPADFDLANTSVNQDTIKKYGALKSFKLANVDLETEGEGKHVYNNASKVIFANWSVDGKTSEEAALNTLAVYNTINDATSDPTDEPEKGEDAENPNTADTIATYITIATVALLGLGATAFVAKKSNR